MMTLECILYLLAYPLKKWKNPNDGWYLEIKVVKDKKQVGIVPNKMAQIVLKKA